MDGWIGWKPRSLDPRLASARLRCLRPISELRHRGYPVELFDPRRTDRYSAVVYSKVYDESSCREAERLKGQGVRIVFDLCDNHFYNPRKLAYWRKAQARLRRMLLLAEELVASTPALAEVMKEEVPAEKPVTIIGDPIETEIENVREPSWRRWLALRQFSSLSRRLRAAQAEGQSPLVWFGNHGSLHAEGGMLDLEKIRPLLERIHRRHPISLTIISNSRTKYRRHIRPWAIPTYYLAWHPETFFPALRLHSIAVIPVGLNPFTRCKSNNRLALALNEGLAVVADPVPSYQAFGAACYLDDWEKGLETYITDPHLRARHIARARSIVENEWTVSRIADRWQDFFDLLLYKKGAGHPGLVLEGP